jgi:hypothetical protein
MSSGCRTAKLRPLASTEQLAHPSRALDSGCHGQVTATLTAPRRSSTRMSDTALGAVARNDTGTNVDCAAARSSPLAKRRHLWTTLALIPCHSETRHRCARRGAFGQHLRLELGK